MQLWGAALPTNSPGTPCILDPVARVGVCGDWLSPNGLSGCASMQAAALSGLDLADRLAQLASLTGQAGDLAVGLTEEFVPLANHDIGGFPGQQPEVVKVPAVAGGNGKGGRPQQQKEPQQPQQQRRPLPPVLSQPQHASAKA
jgi:hypothetical protein